MALSAYFASLSLLKLIKNVPGGVAQGLIWGLMALGVYITFRLLDAADLTVDGSFTLGGAVAVMLILGGCPAWLAVLAAILAGILAGADVSAMEVRYAPNFTKKFNAANCEALGITPPADYVVIE